MESRQEVQLYQIFICSAGFFLCDGSKRSIHFSLQVLWPFEELMEYIVHGIS